MREIERCNPTTLYGVFGTFSKAQWSNKNVLDDARLKDLVEHFSKQRLGNQDYPADLMGDANNEVSRSNTTETIYALLLIV